MTKRVRKPRNPAHGNWELDTRDMWPHGWLIHLSNNKPIWTLKQAKSLYTWLGKVIAYLEHKEKR